MSRSAATAALTLLISVRAQAHGEQASGLSLVWATPDAMSDELVHPLIVTNRGLVFADVVEGVPRFRLRCGEAYEARASDRPAVFLDAAGVLTIGLYHGVYRSSDRACTLQAGSGLPMEPVARVVEAPGPSAQMFVTKPAVDGAALYVSADQGRSWSERYRSPTDEFYDKLLAVPTQADQLYASGVRIDRAKMEVSYLCSRSLDAGRTFREHVHATKVVPLAVHPREPEVVFAYQALDRLETEFRLLRSADGCASFRPVLEPLLQPNAFAASPDGSTAWLGTGAAGKGALYRSSDGGLHFEQLMHDLVQTVTCLHHHQGRLWMCATLAPNETGVWYSEDLGTSFQKFFGFEQVAEPIACNGGADEVCVGPFHDFARDAQGGAAQGRDADAAAPETDAASFPPGPTGLGMDAAPTRAEATATGARGATVEPMDAAHASGCQVSDRHGSSSLAAAIWLFCVGLSRVSSSWLRTAKGTLSGAVRSGQPDAEVCRRR